MVFVRCVCVYEYVYIVFTHVARSVLQGRMTNLCIPSKLSLSWVSPISAAGNTQYVRWDIGILFRSSLYRSTVFGACTYDMD